MPAGNYYAFDDNNCKFETMTKEQIIATIRGAMQTGLIIDEGGIYSSVDEINKNTNIKFWLGTKAEYNAVTEYADNVLYLISDEETQEEIQTQIQQLAEKNSSIYEALRLLQYKINLIENDILHYYDRYDENYTEMQNIANDYNSLTNQTIGAENEIEQINQIINERAVVLFDGNKAILPSVIIPLSESPWNFKTIDIVSTARNRYSHCRIYPYVNTNLLICFTFDNDMWNRQTFEIELDNETDGEQNCIKIINKICEEGNTSGGYIYAVTKVTGFTYQN